MKTYPEILRDLREDRDYTQAQIAEVLGTTQQVYSRYENGINEYAGTAPAPAMRILPGQCRFRFGPSSLSETKAVSSFVVNIAFPAAPWGCVFVY